MSDSVQEDGVESGKSLKNDHTMLLEEEAAGMDPKKTKDSQMVTTTSCSLSSPSYLLSHLDPLLHENAKQKGPSQHGRSNHGSLDPAHLYISSLNWLDSYDILLI